MSAFSDTLFRASPFVQWALSPFLVAFAIFFPWMVLSMHHWDLKGASITVAVETLAVSLLIGLWAPKHMGQIALRIAAFVLFVMYLTYVIIEWRTEKTITIPSGRGQPTLVNALLGLIFIGLPALRYAWRGPSSSSSPSDDEDEDNFEM